MKKVLSGVFVSLFLAISAVFYIKQDTLVANHNIHKVLHYPSYILALSHHLSESMKHLENPTEFEKATAVNDYLYQYLLMKNQIGNYPGEILWNRQGFCGAHARCMVKMLQNAGIRCQEVYLHGIPLMSTHELVQVYFSNGEVGLFDPTFGIYWRSPETEKLLSLQELIQNPSLAKLAITKTDHQKSTKKTDPIHPYYTSDKHYQNEPSFNETIPYEQYFLTMRGAGVYDTSRTEFIILPIATTPTFIGSKSNRDQLIQYKTDDQIEIPWLSNLGNFQDVNWSQIYKISSLEPNKKYVVSLYYVRSIDSTLSVMAIDSTLNGRKNTSTHHIPIEDKPQGTPQAIHLILEAEKEKATLIINNRQGSLYLTAIEFQEWSEEFIF